MVLLLLLIGGRLMAVVEVLLVWLGALVFPGGLAGGVVVVVGWVEAGAVGVGLLVRIRLHVDAGVARLGVGGVSAALRLRVEGVLAGQRPASSSSTALATRRAQERLLLERLLAAATATAAIITLVVVVESTAAVGPALRQGPLPLLLSVHKVRSLLGATPMPRTDQSTCRDKTSKAGAGQQVSES